MTMSLNVSSRTPGAAHSVRDAGQIPAVMYGPGIQPVSIVLDTTVFTKLFDSAGTSTLIDVSVDGKSPAKALIQDIQYDPVKGSIIHVDFRQIDMTKEMHAEVELSFAGEAPAVKELGGTLVKVLESVTVTCLPQHLVSEIRVDLGSLKTFDDLIHIKDLSIPEGITITDNFDTVVAKVAAPLTEEQLKAMEAGEPKSLEDIEVAEKGKKEEEGEEGAGDAKKPEDKKK